uniref:Tubulin-folding cofactor E n=1 Tax=Percolomonas cosmopolitus TaxID=63605 RepID=A0A7S1PH29_9EUKA
MSTPTSIPDPSTLVNTRMRLKEEPPAFIRFVGTLPKRKATYVGVQWDSAQRGKHHTKVDNEEIFSVPKRQNADSTSEEDPALAQSSFSFLKWTTLEAKIENQLQLLEQQKGADACHQASYSDFPVHYDIQRTIGDAVQERYMVDIRDGKVEWRDKTQVELVGMQQVSQRYFHRLDRLNVVSVNHQGVSRIGNLKALATSLETLDLSCNLYSAWEEVLKIFPQAPKLKILMLSGNRFNDWDKLPQLAKEMRSESEALPFTALDTLVLNGTMAHWSDAENLVEHYFPHLKEVHMCDNFIEHITHESGENDAYWEHMEHIDLMNNKIASWSDVQTLAHLKSLQRINLRKNPVQSIQAPSEGEFPQLRSLSLEQSQILKWSDIDALHLFPALSDVRLQGTPLEKQNGRATTRMFTIARVAKLTSMNGSTVSKRERIDAEKYYLKTCADSKMKDLKYGTFDEKKFAVLHPRYKELSLVHGNFEDFVQKEEQKPTAMKQSLVHVLIKNMSSTVNDATMHMEKKLAPSLHVIDLKKMCQRKWKLPVHLQKLYFTPDPEDLFPEELDDDNQEISFFGVRSGGVILMEERDLDKEKREAEEKKRDEEERERQHREHLERMDREKDF